MKSQKSSGFTLIELIVVIAILAILAAIIIPLVTDYIQDSRDAKNEVNCATLYRVTSDELLLDQTPAIGESGAEASEATKGMVITYTVDASRLITSFKCEIGEWSHTEK